MHPQPKRTYFLAFILGFFALSALAQEYDVVLVGGHVVDPQNNIDRVTNIAISQGKISAISDETLSGKQRIDVSGLTVSPGFIDLHSHTPTSRGQGYQALDGVTTALELEAGLYPIDAIEDLLPHGARINYGASVSHLAVRQRILGNTRQAHLLLPATALDARAPMHQAAAYKQPASEQQIDAIAASLDAGLRDGGLGIGLLLDYLSEAVSDAELKAVFDIAARHRAPVIAHIRRGLPGDSSGLQELISQSERSGAGLHVCHINASAMGYIGEFLQLIAEARKRGVDVTTEAYPYNAGSTTIGAAVFARDWRSIFAIDYADVEWAETGERFNADSFASKRISEPDGIVIHHYGKEQWTREAILAPEVMVASDAMPILETTSGVHPRGIGTFSRVLSHYTRVGDAEGSMTLSEAIYKMSMAPAKRLRAFAPVFKNKGHLGIGADADITVFDARKIQDLATYQTPLTASEGVRYLMVGGEWVVKNGMLIDESRNGKLIKAR
jgi:N-acyl-D-aspartate/D-glutamate deacylase